MLFQELPCSSYGPSSPCNVKYWSTQAVSAPTCAADKCIDMPTRLPQYLWPRTMIMRQVVALILELIRKEPSRLVL